MYNVKKDVNDNIARFKARWVVKDYLQQFSIDFDQTFAAILNLKILRVLFIISVFYNLNINQIDIKSYFFYSFIDQLI